MKSEAQKAWDARARVLKAWEAKRDESFTSWEARTAYLMERIDAAGLKVKASAKFEDISLIEGTISADPAVKAREKAFDMTFEYLGVPIPDVDVVSLLKSLPHTERAALCERVARKHGGLLG